MKHTIITFIYLLIFFKIAPFSVALMMTNASIMGDILAFMLSLFFLYILYRIDHAPTHKLRWFQFGFFVGIFAANFFNILI